MATVKENWKILIKNDPTRIGFDEDEDLVVFGKTEEDDDMGFKFATAAEIERDSLLKLVKSSTVEKVTLSSEGCEPDEPMVSIDDL